MTLSCAYNRLLVAMQYNPTLQQASHKASGPLPRPITYHANFPMNLVLFVQGTNDYTSPGKEMLLSDRFRTQAKIR